jgi:hypothetical protein
MPDTDWASWHDPYDDPRSPLSHRLRAVREQIALALDRSSPGRIRLLSLCAGRGLDVLPLLPLHPRGSDVVGRLVELDERNCAAARELAPPRIEVVQGDAGTTNACAGAVPADLLLLCGIFGNVSDEHVRRTVEAAPSLCAPGATALWTRSTHDPDLTPSVRQWWAQAGFTETAFVTGGAESWSVGAAVLSGEPRPFLPGQSLFTFAVRPPASS